MKVCNKCDLWLQSCEYYQDARNADGLSGSCKECQKAAARESSRRRYTVKNTMSQLRDSFGRFQKNVPAPRERSETWQLIQQTTRQ